jgi:RimJ/RimL family protein N-acetyltransferase
MNDILAGSLVRLAAIDPAEQSRLSTATRSDSEFMRLMDSDPIRLFSAAAMQKFFEKDAGGDSGTRFRFAVRAIADGVLIGFVGLYVLSWGAREAALGIGLNRRELWGRGFGTEAVQLMLRFAFTELNLRRVTLSVFSYNTRAVRSYEKAGFQQEGRLRGAVRRGDARADEIFMGILHDEWRMQEQHLQRGNIVEP